MQGIYGGCMSTHTLWIRMYQGDCWTKFLFEILFYFLQTWQRKSQGFENNWLRGEMWRERKKICVQKNEWKKPKIILESQMKMKVMVRECMKRALKCVQLRVSKNTSRNVILRVMLCCNTQEIRSATMMYVGLKIDLSERIQLESFCRNYPKKRIYLMFILITAFAQPQSHYSTMLDLRTGT